MLGFFLKGVLMKRILLLIYLTFVFPVGEAGAIFLLIAPGASAAGTGEAQVAKANDAYASYYNPAGLGFQTQAGMAGMHVNWLPNLADDLYYEFLAYKQPMKGMDGTLGGHLIYLNLGEQMGMDEMGRETGQFKSYMWALALGYGTKVSSSSSVGVNFKVFHQKLADSGTGSEQGDPYSTDFAFDLGYLKKFGTDEDLKKRSKSSENPYSGSSSECIEPSKSYGGSIDDFLNSSFEICNSLNDAELFLVDVRQFLDSPSESSVGLLSNLNDTIKSIKSGIDSAKEAIEGSGGIAEEAKELSGMDKLKAIKDIASATKNFKNIIETAPSVLNQLTSLLDPLSEYSEGLQIAENNSNNNMVSVDELSPKDDSININVNIHNEIHNETTIINQIVKKKKWYQGPLHLGFSISNIGPEIDFVDADQADPAPTNLKFGLYKEFRINDYNKINVLLDINRLMVARYPAMDWNEDGFLQDDGVERGYTDPWYKAIITCWLDDWYYKYDRDYDGDNYIGGHEQVFGEFKAFTTTGAITSEYTGDPYNDELYGYQEGSPCGTSTDPYCNQNIPYNNGYNITTINYLDSADGFEDTNNDGYWNPPEPFYENSDVWHELYDNASTNLSDYQYIDCSLPTSSCANGTITDGHWIYYNTFETQGAIVRVDLNEDGETIDGVYYDNGVRDLDEGIIDWDNDGNHDSGETWDQDLNGNGTFDTGYSATNDNGTKEVGSGEDYTFADELKELIANFGLEYWYTDSFVLRAGYIYDKEGKIMNPTFGAGIRFGQYGFDFGYTAGDQDHARANTMFFSVSMEL